MHRAIEVSRCFVFFPVSQPSAPSLYGSSLSSGWNRSCFTPPGHSRLVLTDCVGRGGGVRIHPSASALAAVRVRLRLGGMRARVKILAGPRHD